MGLDRAMQEVHVMWGESPFGGRMAGLSLEPADVVSCRHLWHEVDGSVRTATRIAVFPITRS